MSPRMRAPSVISRAAARRGKEPRVAVPPGVVADLVARVRDRAHHVRVPRRALADQEERGPDVARVQEPQEPGRRHRIGPVVERERDLASARRPAPPGDRGQDALRSPGVGGPRRGARTRSPPARRAPSSPSQEAEHLLGHGARPPPGAAGFAPWRPAPRGARARPGGRPGVAAAPARFAPGAPPPPRPGRPRWPAPGPGGTGAAGAAARARAPRRRSWRPPSRRRGRRRPSRAPCPPRGRGSGTCASPSWRRRSRAASRWWSPQTASATNGRSSDASASHASATPRRSPRMPPVTSTTGTSAGNPSAARSASRSGGTVKAESTGSPLVTTRSGEMPLGHDARAHGLGGHEVALQARVDPLRMRGEVREDDPVRHRRRPAGAQPRHGAGGRRVEVHDRVGALPLEVAQQARRADPVHPRHGRRPGADPRRELVGEPPQTRGEAQDAPEHRERGPHEGRRHEADEVVEDLDPRPLVRERPGQRLGGAEVAGAVRSGQDQDPGHGSAARSSAAHAPKRRSRCW